MNSTIIDRVNQVKFLIKIDLFFEFTQKQLITFLDCSTFCIFYIIVNQGKQFCFSVFGTNLIKCSPNYIRILGNS